MPTTNLSLPAMVNSDIYQGTPWPGVEVLFADENDEPETVTVTADVATDTIAKGGVWLAACDIAEPDDTGSVAVTLDAEVTASLPARTVLIDVLAAREGDEEPTLVMRVTATVHSSLPAEPQPEEP